MALFLFCILLLVGLGIRNWSEIRKVTGLDEVVPDSTQALQNLNEFGDPIDPDISSPETGPGQTENDVYISVLKQMLECLDIEAPSPSVDSVQIEQLLRLVEPSLGKAQIVERWRAWHVRDPQARERRVRIETVENDEGQVSRELHYYGVDADGQVYPLELDPRDVMNPSDQIIQGLLSKGQMFYQEVAMAGLFPGGERIEYVNKNSQLAEIEFLKSDRVFNCQSVLRPSTCICTR